MKKTQDDVTELYKSIGEAIWMLQHLEYVMTHFNALSIIQTKREKGQYVGEKEASPVLEKQRKLTLGPLIKAAKNEHTLPLTLEAKFDSLLIERNWLIHRCLIDDFFSLEKKSKKQNLFERIANFTNYCIVLREEIFGLMEIWYQNSGYSIKKAYEMAEILIGAAQHNR